MKTASAIKTVKHLANLHLLDLHRTESDSGKRSLASIRVLKFRDSLIYCFRRGLNTTEVSGIVAEPTPPADHLLLK